MYKTEDLEIPHDDGDTSSEKIIEIMEGRVAPRNYNEQQIFLATALFKQQNEDVILNPLDADERKQIMAEWQSKGFSDDFREMNKHEDFTTNSILQGDPTKITLDHLEHFKFTGKLPE